MARKTALLGIALLCVTALLSGCKALYQQTTYVSLGDSYTANPGMDARDTIDGCIRSTENYPRQVARATGLTLKDVSCSGAQTRHVFEEQVVTDEITVDPQIEGVVPSAQVVSIGLGFNDFYLAARIFGTCSQLAETDPDGTPCADADTKSQKTFDESLAEVPDNLTKVVEAVQERAPKARIILIGYPQMFPDGDEGCDNLPIATGDIALVRNINIRMNKAIASVAKKTGSTYLDLYGPSKGHDICSDDPWIAGEKALDGDAVPWHPYRPEADFVAELLTEVIEQG